MAPVALPTPRLGQDARVIAAENRRAAVTANRRLVDSRTWYECQRKTLETGKVQKCGQ